MLRSLICRGGLAGLVAGLLVSPAWAQAPWVAPEVEKGKKNPLKAESKVVADGKKAALANCLPCHGPGGKGDGAQAAALTPKPADWTSARVQDMSDGEIFWKLSNGRGPMPPWKHLPEKERWSLVHYIRTLKK